MDETNNKGKTAPRDVYQDIVPDWRKAELEELCRNLGITMNNYRLLDIALTHSSFAHERVIPT